MTIGVKRDLVDENDESFTLQLLNPTTEAVVANATGTIMNDDNNSKLSIGDATADEPSSGTATMTFTVTLSQASARKVTRQLGDRGRHGDRGSRLHGQERRRDLRPGQTSEDCRTSLSPADAANEPNETL